MINHIIYVISFFQKELTKKYYDETAPRILRFIEKQLCQNKEGSGFFLGDKVCSLTAKMIRM